MSNIIKVSFGNRREATASAQWQGDYGQILQFYGLKLPDTYEVHFSNSPYGGTAKTQIGNADGVEIPAEYFVTGDTIYAWLFLHTGADDGETEYMATIPIKRKPQPTDEPPTPQEQSAITQAIAALNEGVERAEAAADGIEDTINTALQEAKDSGEFDGKDGQDGFSPSARVDSIEDKVVITVTDKSGTTTAEISGNGLPSGGQSGDLLARNGANDAEWITPANNAEQDNTRPITAAAVYTEIGNINALLATI